VTAANLPSGFTEEQFGGNLSGSPTAMAFAPDGRLFVCQQGGQLRVIKTGSLLSTPFVSLTVDSSGERGLLGIAFDPNFATNHYLYVYYTVATSPIHNRVSRFTAAGDTAVPGSEAIILELDNLSSATNHNGGAIHFGPDGKLYIGVGENANGYDLDESANSQLAAISTRAQVGIGADVLIGGFITGNKVGATRIAVRALGPTLQQFGIVNPLPDPTLELHDANGALLTSNDNWQSDASQAALITGYGLAPPNSVESAIAISLAPGPYTAIVTGKNNQTGIGLIEIYDEQ